MKDTKNNIQARTPYLTCPAQEIFAVWEKCDHKCVYGQGMDVSLDDFGIVWTITKADPDGPDELSNREAICMKHSKMKSQRNHPEFESWLKVRNERECDF